MRPGTRRLWIPDVSDDGDAVLPLADGSGVVITGRPAQGTRHDVLFGRDRSDGAEVVVKIERVAGALANEQVALQWLTGRSHLTPRLRRVSEVPLADGRSPVCLVMDRVSGVAPVQGAGWSRMGTALAQMNAIAWEGTCLPIHQPGAFAESHAGRVRELEGSLTSAIAQPEDLSMIYDLPLGSTALVLTHGDPGPGNFLDDGGVGHLIDFESAQVAPLGLDLGRVMFIALLGSGPEGFPARDHARRARTAATAFLDQTADVWRPTRDQLRAWLTVAAIQFAHRRQQRAGQPGVQPATRAIATLADAVAGADWLPT